MSRLHASGAKRFYFYYLNERGNLFHVFDVKGLVQGHRIPSGPTFLTDTKFLDFFHRRLEYNHVGHVQAILGGREAAACAGSSTARATIPHGQQEGDSVEADRTAMFAARLHSPEFLFRARCVLEDGTAMSPFQMLLHFPYVSPCGAELNFIKPQDGVPVVFSQLHLDGSDSTANPAGGMQATLQYAGSLTEPFDPSTLVVSPDGKMFHQLTSLRRFPTCARKSEAAAMDVSSATLESPAEESSADFASNIDRFLVQWSRCGSVMSSSAASSSVRPAKPNLPSLLSSADMAEHPSLRRYLFQHSQEKTTTVAASASGEPDSDTVALTTESPTSVGEMERLLEHVVCPPRGLLGASIGLQLGLDFMDEDTDSDGHYTMEWNGERKVLPFW